MKTVLDIYHAAMPGVVLERKSAREWAGPCIFCGGRDRMALMPERDPERGGHWLCRHCTPKGADGIELVRRVYNMSYGEACRELDIEPKHYDRGQGGYAGTRRQTSSCKGASQGKGADVGHKGEEQPELRRPPDAWIVHAARVCQVASRGLESSAEGQDLLASRGISMATARAWCLGWLHKDRFDRREEWGLPSMYQADGVTPVTLALPRGLYMPAFRGGKIVSLGVRMGAGSRILKPGGPKHRQIAGSASSAICRCKGGARGHRKPVLVLESYLDAVLAWQEAGDLVDVLALTGAAKWPDREVDAWLKAAPLVLANLDDDSTGEVRTDAWVAAYGATDCPCIAGKDLTEQAQQGLPVRVWLEGVLSDATDEETAPPSPADEDARPVHQDAVEDGTALKGELSGGDGTAPGAEQSPPCKAGSGQEEGAVTPSMDPEDVDLELEPDTEAEPETEEALLARIARGNALLSTLDLSDVGDLKEDPATGEIVCVPPTKPVWQAKADVYGMVDDAHPYPGTCQSCPRWARGVYPDNTRANYWFKDRKGTCTIQGRETWAQDRCRLQTA